MVAKVHWEANGTGRIMRPGVTSLAVLDGNFITVAVTRLDPGHEVKPHKHENEQIACILAGTIAFNIGGEVVVLGPGDILHIPAHVEHYGQVVGSDPVINLDAWYPRRTPGT
jgi:quercetin dioxygenase-like cupin family protein